MLKTKDYGEEISWSFGSCSSQGTYGSDKEVASMAHEGSSGGGENVCINLMLKTKDYGEEISWSFGSCSSQGTYESNKVYNIECCQPAGTYDFKCEDSYGD